MQHTVERSKGRAESPEYDGIRRCQRLPELTHPVDSARLHPDTSKGVPRENGLFFEESAITGVRCRGRADLREGRSVPRAKQPFAGGMRLPPVITTGGF